MRKSILNSVYIFTLIIFSITIHKAFAQRSPSVEPIAEIDYESSKVDDGKPQQGFDFSSANNHPVKKRTPAGITANANSNSPWSYAGPIIFLLALPYAIWFIITRKIMDKETESTVDYYPKTFQFKPYKTEYQKNDSDDDIDYPKAS